MNIFRFVLFVFLFSTTLNAQTYRNPISTFSCADPAVFYDQGASNKFVLACTGGRFFLRQSNDLINWTGMNKKIINSQNGLASWAKTNPNWPTPNRSWAPHLTKIDNRYVAYYTQNASGGYGAIGVSETTDIFNLNFEENHNYPLARNDRDGGIIDPSYFKDPQTGKHYLLYKIDGNSKGLKTKIVIREMGPYGAGYNTSTPSSPKVIKVGGNQLDTLVEGQELIKRNGYYYLFYSHGSYLGSYKVKVARSQNIYGPYVGDRIVLQGNKRFYGPGHGTITTVKGKQYYFYHAYDKQQEATNGKTRYAMLDRIYWQDNWPLINNGYPSSGAHYSPKSSKAWFHNVLIKTKTTDLINPKFSLDVITRSGTRIPACYNAGKIGSSTKFKFFGTCQNGRKISIHSDAKFRICAAENGNFRSGVVRCSSYQNFNSAEKYVHIKK